MGALVAQSITLTTSYVAVSSVEQRFSGEISARTDNTGDAYLQDDDGSGDVALEAGEWKTFQQIDLSGLSVKGTAGDVLTVIGEVI